MVFERDRFVERERLRRDRGKAPQAPATSPGLSSALRQAREFGTKRGRTMRT